MVLKFEDDRYNTSRVMGVEVIQFICVLKQRVLLEYCGRCSACVSKETANPVTPLPSRDVSAHGLVVECHIHINKYKATI